ncbi:MAG: hypothetical protein PVJ55_03320 [Anaerolineae bacterium]|jgi:hypothetical protein
MLDVADGCKALWEAGRHGLPLDQQRMLQPSLISDSDSECVITGCPHDDFAHIGRFTPERMSSKKPYLWVRFRRQDSEARRDVAPTHIGSDGPARPRHTLLVWTAYDQ